jgi:adenylate kinase family enzyme
MYNGLLILGLNGCGKSTVGRIVAEELGLFLMDAEDYYFPVPGDFSNSRTPEEAHRLMEADAAAHDGFVLCCVRCNISDALLRQIRLAIVLRAPADVRALRIVQREEERFGSRVLPGGDMYESQQHFRAFAASRSEATVDQSLARLSCPVVEINASLPLETVVQEVVQAYEKAPLIEEGS